MAESTGRDSTTCTLSEADFAVDIEDRYSAWWPWTCPAAKPQTTVLPGATFADQQTSLPAAGEKSGNRAGPMPPARVPRRGRSFGKIRQGDASSLGDPVTALAERAHCDIEPILSRGSLRQLPRAI